MNTRHRPNSVSVALLSAAAVLLGGCVQTAILVEAIQGPKKIPPAYVLEDVPTAVLVDDPHHLLDNPGLARQIGTTAVHYLTTHEALVESTFVEPRDVARLESEFGRDWPLTPIDEIGRRLGAEQVIYAKITRVQIQSIDSLYRPEAMIEVKVLRSADGVRLWPSAQVLPDPANPSPGHTVVVNLPYKTRSGEGGVVTPNDVGRQLADELGLNLARLFYEYAAAAPGDGL